MQKLFVLKDIDNSYQYVPYKCPFLINIFNFLFILLKKLNETIFSHNYVSRFIFHVFGFEFTGGKK